MGDKNKGSRSGTEKKPKTAKVGHRPHEERQRQALTQTNDQALRPSRG